MDEPQPLCALVHAKIVEQIELTERLISLLPEDGTGWRSRIDGGRTPGFLLGHLLDCLSGFCAVFYAVAPDRLATLAALRELPVNHNCSPREAASRIAAYRAGIDAGFGAIRDGDLNVPVPTVFVKRGEPLLTLLLGNLEHLINHKHELFMNLKMMGVKVGTVDLYRFRAD